MKKKYRALAFICVAGTALTACSADDSLSGKYAADFEGERMVINFIDDSKATFTMGESCAWRIPTSSCHRKLEETATMLLPAIVVNIQDLKFT